MNKAVAHEEDICRQVDECHARIEIQQAEIRDLEAELQSIEKELEGIADERQQYELLAAVCGNLEKLDAIGGSGKFWPVKLGDDQVKQQLKKLREKVGFYERRIKKITDRREAAIEGIRKRQADIEYLEEDVEFLREQEEEAKNEYVVEREIKPIPYRVVVMPWAKRGEDEKRYRKILFLSLLISILLGLLVPLYELPIPDRIEVVEVPERLARLIKKEPPKPKPQRPSEPKPATKQEPEKPEKVKSEKKKAPAEKEHKAARTKAKGKGVLAFKNNFAELLDEAPLEKLAANANLSDAGSTAKQSERSLLTAQAKRSSEGIRSSAVSRNVAGTGDKLEAVAFSRVESDIGTGRADERPLSEGPGPSRTDEEIQIVFDRYKAALYRIYNRELRVNPTLQGKVVLRITIEPDGSVSLCKVESTDLESKTLLAKIVDRVKRFNFGAKEGVPTITILYPIDFLPAS